MIETGLVTDDEVVLAFLQGEVDSPLYGINSANVGPIYRRVLTQVGFAREELINHGELLSPSQNSARKLLLGAVRGYPDRFLFAGFPRDATWRQVKLEGDEVRRLRYGRFDNWVALSGGTRSVFDGATRIASSRGQTNAMPVVQTITDAVQAVAIEVNRGKKYPPLIAAEATDGCFILLEGHTRATAYVVAKTTEGLELYVAASPHIAQWGWY
jgi:hypothetical protein